ncbi:MAG: hypothetical protein J1F22_03630 [Lachnospiraceae bacterium]|nr:hypothetical protein [Lachnospiraceae bacterium]
MKKIGLVLLLGGLLTGLLSGCGTAASSGGAVKEAESANVVDKESASSEESAEEKPVRMIRVNDTLYYEAGKCEREPTCGTMDGRIERMTKNYAIPTKNGQSNFGKGYGYQWDNGGIDVKIGEEWYFFKKKKTK